MKLTDFVTRRMEPFGGLKPPFGMAYDDMFPALRDCLIELSGLGKGAAKPTELEWMQSEAGRRIEAVCIEAGQAEETPTTTALRAIWSRLYPPPQTARESCPRCHGSGFIVVEGPYFTSAVYPCSHGEPSAADRRMGVRIHPVVAHHYGEEARGIPERRLKHEAFTAAHPPKPLRLLSRADAERVFRPVTQADFDRLRKSPASETGAGSEAEAAS